MFRLHKFRWSIACRALLVAALAIFLLPSSPNVIAQSAGSQPLVYANDLTYLGIMRLPDIANSGVGMALTFNPNRNSFYAVGFDRSASAYATAEISIPAIGGRGTLLQSLRDSTEGRLAQIGNDGGNGRLFGGQLVYNNRLYQSAFIYYDASGSQTTSHFSRPLDLSVTGQVTGPFRVGTMNPGFVSGYMGVVPAEWQAALGGPAVTGNCCLSIIGRTSFGPDLFAFNPEAPANATPLVYYDEGHQTLAPYAQPVVSPIFNGSTRVTGVVIPRGSSTALFFGSTGKGVWCYGDGSQCGDPSDYSKGDHAYPYVAYVWAYNLNDLAAVKAGTKRPWEVKPYATWELPDVGPTWNNFGTGGVAYDPATQRIYLLQSGGDSNGDALVRVYSVAAGAAGPPPSDTTAPSVSITSPSSGATVSGTVTITASASDNVGVSSVWFTVDGANVGLEDASAPYQLSWNTTGVSNGSHTLRAVARDTSGNATTSSAVTVTVNNVAGDTTAPSVSISSPSAGATVSGTISLTASASDNVGVVGVQFLVDGNNFGSEDTSAPYQVSWATTGAANGSHQVRARARDAAGNTTTSSIVTVTVSNASADTTAPTVSITAPSPGTSVSGNVTVSATASDNVGVVSVQFTVDGSNLGSADTSAPYQTTWNASAASNGTHVLRAVARDAAGNTTTSSAVSVNVGSAAPTDNVAPTVSVTSPSANAALSGSVTLRANASDNVAVIGVKFTVDGVDVSTEDTSSPYERTWNTTSASTGTHVVRAVARDAVGNVTISAPITVTVNNGPAPDTVAPTVALTSPAAGATVSGVITIAATATDNISIANVQFTLDGSPLGAADASSPYSISWDTESATNGTHTLRAIARDAAGNTASSSSRTVTVKNASAPTPPPAAPTSGVAIAIDNIAPGATVRPPFAISGWAIDSRSTNGPGILFMQVWAVPHASGRSPVYLGWVNPMNPRPYTGGLYGARFTNSGFDASLSNVPPGDYTLALFPYSTVTNSFENGGVKTLPVTVLPGVVTVIDTPVWGQVYGNAGIGMTISGWAVDARQASGTGIDVVDVWAVNAENGVGTRLGSANLGIARSEPLSYFGSSRFAPGGYSLTNTAPLPPGTYYILVFSHSVGEPSFNVSTISAAIIQ